MLHLIAADISRYHGTGTISYLQGLKVWLGIHQYFSLSLWVLPRGEEENIAVTARVFCLFVCFFAWNVNCDVLIG